MRSHAPYTILFALVMITTACLSGCGGGSSTSATATPTFTSAPVTLAVEGGAYSYTLGASVTDGSTVDYALSTAPNGASLSGSTVTWTPTAAQSRVSNSFKVTATTSKGGTASQSWTVTPNGTIRVTEVNTYWGPNGSATGPTFNWSAVYPAAAVLVPQASGTFEAIYGTSDGNGVLSFQNVPAGYFWLSLNTLSNYWTSSSAVDMGHDLIGGPVTPLSSPVTTTFDFNLTGVDFSPNTASYQFFTIPSGIDFGETGFAGGIINSEASATGTTDFSQLHYGIALESKSASLGPIDGYVLGAELTLPNLTLTNGATNTISGMLTASPQASLPLKINGSAWTSMFDNTGPTTPTLVSSPFILKVDPFITGVNANSSPAVGLFWPAPASPNSSSTASFNYVALAPGSCLSGFSETVTLGGNSIAPLLPPVISSDTDFGTINYGDPFPATWPRVFQLCQQAALALPDLTTTATVLGTGGPETETISWSYNLTNTQTIALPATPVTPMLSPVSNPTVNGASLFTPATLDTRALNLSWSKPTTGAPFGYSVQIRSLPTASTLGTILSTPTTVLAGLKTAQTSMIVPPELLKAGQTYMISITALMDGKANMETSPLRSALPTASADVVSAPITISASAP